MGSSLRRPWWLACATAVCSLVLAHAAAADTIQLSWDRNPEPEVQGYVVYAGTSSGAYTFRQDVGAATSFVFPSAVAGKEYFFAVSAYTDSGESAKSAEVAGYSNVPPVFTPTANQVSAKGATVLMSLTAKDPYGDVVSFKAAGLPPGLMLTESTGLISGTPTTSGNYRVTATATDGVLSATETFDWTVSQPVPTLLVAGSAAPNFYVKGPNATFTINGTASGYTSNTIMWLYDNNAVRHDMTPSPTWSQTITLRPGPNVVQAWLKEPRGLVGTVRIRVYYTP